MYMYRVADSCIFFNTRYEEICDVLFKRLKIRDQFVIISFSFYQVSFWIILWISNFLTMTFHLILWILYIVSFISVLVPASFICLRLSTINQQSNSGWFLNRTTCDSRTRVQLGIVIPKKLSDRIDELNNVRGMLSCTLLASYCIIYRLVFVTRN